MSEERMSHMIASLSDRTNGVWVMDAEYCQKHALSRFANINAISTGQDFISKIPMAEKEGVAVVDIKGVFMPSAEYSDEVDTGLLTELINKLAVDDSVGAVVYDIESPGGVAAGMSELVEASTALSAAKPVYAYTGMCMCSAAYWLAATAGAGIYAGPDADVGSIGTRIFTFDLSKMFAEMGVEPVAIDTGPFKSMGAFGTELTAEHRSHLQDRVNSVQEDFSAAVKAGRDFNEKQLESVLDGKTFRVAEAVSLGLLDGTAKRSDVLAMAHSAVAKSNHVKIRSKKMSSTTDAPVAATLAELKKAMPESTAEFRESQIESGASLAESLSAYNKILKEENENLLREREEAKAAQEERAAAEAKAKADLDARTAREAQATKKRGHKLAESTAKGGDKEDAVDYHSMARGYQKSNGCRWSEACLAIKKQHPEARTHFGAPALEED